MLEGVVIRNITHIPNLMTLGKKAFQNILEKGENAGNQHFLLFPQHFLPDWRQK